MYYATLTSGVTAIDTQWITDFVTLIKEGIALCCEFPLNLLLTACLISAGIGVFGKLKRVLIH